MKTTPFEYPTQLEIQILEAQTRAVMAVLAQRGIEIGARPDGSILIPKHPEITNRIRAMFTSMAPQIHRQLTLDPESPDVGDLSQAQDFIRQVFPKG